MKCPHVTHLSQTPLTIICGRRKQRSYRRRYRNMAPFRRSSNRSTTTHHVSSARATSTTTHATSLTTRMSVGAPRRGTTHTYPRRRLMKSPPRIEQRFLSILYRNSTSSRKGLRSGTRLKRGLRHRGRARVCTTASTSCIHPPRRRDLMLCGRAALRMSTTFSVLPAKRASTTT